MQNMYYIELDVHKRTISYCVKDGSGKIHGEGTIPAALKVAHPLMLRAIAAAKKKNDRIDATKIAIACGVIFCRSASWPPQQFANAGARCGIATCWCARWCR